MSDQLPKLLSDDMIVNSLIISMGCMDKESCPSLFVKDTLNWNISDPKEKSIDKVRAIRDRIKHNVLSLIKSLDGDT